MYRIGRENVMLENIVKYKPDLVFLGGAHAARFYLKKNEIFEKYGINIEEYWSDEVIKNITQDDLLMAMSASSEYVPTEKYLEHDIEVELKKIESLDEVTDDIYSVETERLYKAVKEGRVTDGDPHFIGTWDSELEHRGLFEMYIEERVNINDKDTIIGKIEDCLGSARFTGEIEDNRISFVKTYEKVYNNIAAKEKIFFEGFLQENGEYTGKYEMSGGFRDFKMKQLKDF